MSFSRPQKVLLALTLTKKLSGVSSNPLTCALAGQPWPVATQIENSLAEYVPGVFLRRKIVEILVHGVFLKRKLVQILNLSR